MSADPASRPVWARGGDVLWRRSLDAVVLLPPGADEPVTLPGTGAVVWDLLVEPVTLPELVAALADVYADADATDAHATIERDVASLLERLRALGAVESTALP